MPALLHCWHHLMLFCFAHAFTFSWLRFMVEFIRAFSLSCTDLRKVSIEDSDHAISQMVVLIAEIEDHSFYIYSALYLSGAGLTCSVLACRLLCILACMFPLHSDLSSVISINHWYHFLCMIPNFWTFNMSLFQLLVVYIGFI